MTTSVAMIVPVRRFADGKTRLAPALSDLQRRNLARNCAEGVLVAARGRPCYVVGDDPEIALWAAQLGVETIAVSTTGLNESLSEALPLIVDRAKADHIAVCHADLPLAHDLSTALDDAVRHGGTTIVTDLEGDGTNVLIAPTELMVATGFHYGPGSASRHRDLYGRNGSKCRVITHPTLSIDIDHPSDLQRPAVKVLIDRLVSP